MRRALWILVAAGATLLPLLPLPVWVGAPDQGPAWSVQLASWGLGSVIVLALALIGGRLAVALPPRRPRLRLPSDWVLVLSLAVVLVAVAAVIGQVAFAGNPHLLDEMAQLFQARVYLSGRLAAPVPEHPEFFLFANTWITPAGWASQFPPGHAALLALGLAGNATWLVNPLLGGIDLVLVYLIARGLYDRKTALMAATLWLAAAWVLFMSATYMNHAGAVTFALGAWALVWGVRRPDGRHLAAAGLLLGLAAATRPLDAVAAAVPVVVWLLRHGHGRRLGWLALGGLPVALLLGAINARLYGHPLTLGYTALYGPEVGLGFHVDPWGNPYTPLVGLSNVAVAVRRLHIYLFEWPIPALLPLAVWAAAARHRHPADLVVVLGVLAGPALYFFYWHSGFYPGPRFYYIAAPFLIMGTARAVRWAWVGARRAAGKTIRWDGAVATAGVVLVAWSAVSLIPARVESFRTSLTSLKLHPERQLARAGVRQALVFVPESWGARVIVNLWALGVLPGVVERAYRRVDTCDLHLLVRRARTAAWTSSAVTGAVRELVSDAGDPPPAGVAPDPTVRLRPRATLPEPCRVELARDREGFTLYGSLAWRNSVTRDAGIVFARDLFGRNAELLAEYPGWPVWRFAPASGEPGAPMVLERVTGEGMGS